MNISQIVSSRYSTKSFDPYKKISEQDFAQIKALIRFSPSSVNSQGWHFILADDDVGKARIAKAAEAYPYNAPKILNASHVVVFCSKQSVDKAHLNAVLDQEEQDGRFATPAETRPGRETGRGNFVALHRETLHDENEWLARQVYLNIGFTLMGVAAMGIDSVALEGLDFNVLNQEFGLTDKGYNALCVVAFGYRNEDDFNADLPKSRLAEELIFSQA